MRLAHLADIHLGYRQGSRSTPAGINQREADVAGAFRFAIDGILAAKPDLVCVAGDLFNTPRPSNAAITFAFKQLRRLRDAGLPVVLVGGNHDQSKTAETGSILRLFLELGIDVATNEVRQFDYPHLELSVTAVPDRCPLEGVGPGPLQHRVLVIHGSIEGSCPNWTIPLSLVDSEAWSYTALGDFHMRKQVAGRAWYTGSLEFTSTNIWSEAATPKGWLLVDTETGTVEPQLVPTRRVLDLEPIDATGLEADAVNGLIGSRLVDTADAVVRLRVVNVPKEVRRALDWKCVRRKQAECLSLKLEIERPALDPSVPAFQKRMPLSEIVAQYLGQRELPAGMDRKAFLRAGRELLDESIEGSAA